MEFSVPAPDLLTQEYAAYVLAEIYRAEDELIRTTVESPDEDVDALPEQLRTLAESVYADDALETETAAMLQTLAASDEDELFVPDPGRTKLSNIELIDATQQCLVIRFVDKRDELLKEPVGADETLVLLEPKPQIEATGFNRTPWNITLRASVENVLEASC